MDDIRQLKCDCCDRFDVDGIQPFYCTLAAACCCCGAVSVETKLCSPRENRKPTYRSRILIFGGKRAGVSKHTVLCLTYVALSGVPRMQ